MTPRPPRISRADVIDGALAELDSTGLDAFSMRRLGARLGVDPMALYRHVPNQAALFDAVVEQIWCETAQCVQEGDGPDIDQPHEEEQNEEGPDEQGGAPVPGAAPQGAPAASVIALGCALRQVLLKHPAAVRLVATRPVVTSQQLALVEEVLARLAVAGIEPAEAMRLLDCTIGYVVGKVLGELRQPVGGVDQDAPAVWQGLDPAALPHLVAAMTGGYDWDPDGEFLSGLHALVLGWGRG